MSRASEPPASKREGGTDEWQCLRCGDQFTLAAGSRPNVCPNPNCLKHGPFKALTGPWTYFEDHRFLGKKLADDIMQDYHFATHMRSEVIYVYRDGVYRPGGESVIKREAQVKLGELGTVHRVNEVIGHVLRSTYVEPEKFEALINLINLANRILDLNTGELKLHTPKLIFLNQLPVRYDPNATCPAIERFLNEVLRESDREIVIELIGYCLWRDYHIQKAVLFVGEGANGKSTLLGLIEAFLGKENCSGVPLQDLLTNRFAPAHLYGKLVNTFADLPSRALRETGMFKALTGGDLIKAEHKFKNPFDFVNYAKLIFSANQVPPTVDRSDAFFRRWLIIDFPNQFEGERADKHILEKLTTPEELSGLLNLAILGLKRLWERGDFSRSEATEIIAERYTKLSNPVAGFVEERCEVGPEFSVTKEKLYESFVNYCNQIKFSPLSYRSFHDALRKMEPLAEGRVDGKGKRTWKGIRLKEPRQPTIADYERA